LQGGLVSKITYGIEMNAGTDFKTNLLIIWAKAMETADKA